MCVLYDVVKKILRIKWLFIFTVSDASSMKNFLFWNFIFLNPLYIVFVEFLTCLLKLNFFFCIFLFILLFGICTHYKIFGFEKLWYAVFFHVKPSSSILY